MSFHSMDLPTSSMQMAKQMSFHGMHDYIMTLKTYDTDQLSLEAMHAYALWLLFWHIRYCSDVAVQFSFKKNKREKKMSCVGLSVAWKIDILLSSLFTWAHGSLQRSYMGQTLYRSSPTIMGCILQVSPEIFIYLFNTRATISFRTSH
uniref:Uncharacterized protein n=1 Tax=Oryza brachyantha TaxID=4533 RepID=J3N5H9_ORYBR